MGRYSAARDLDLSPRARWYLVANRAEARIYEERPRRKLELVGRLENPEGRLFESELDSDRPGRGYASASNRRAVISHGLDRTADHHEVTARRFAARIARLLEDDAHAERFRHLIVFAEPRFLGLLRDSFGVNVRHRVSQEITRELMDYNEQGLHRLILDMAQPAQP